MCSGVITIEMYGEIQCVRRHIKVGVSFNGNRQSERGLETVNVNKITRTQTRGKRHGTG